MVTLLLSSKPQTTQNCQARAKVLNTIFLKCKCQLARAVLGLAQGLLKDGPGEEGFVEKNNHGQGRAGQGHPISDLGEDKN